MNRVLLVALVLVAIAAAWYVSGRAAKPRAEKRKASLASWNDWGDDARLDGIRQTMCEMIDNDAERWRGNVVFIASVMVLGSLSLFSLQDATDKVERQGAELTQVVASQCATSAGFRQIISAGLTDQIRRTQVRRDDLADATISLQQDKGRTPGFEDLDPASQQFVLNYTDAQIIDNQRRLTNYDGDLVRLRSQVDVVRTFNAGVNCSLPA